jgi:thioredoxin 1
MKITLKIFHGTLLVFAVILLMACNQIANHSSGGNKDNIAEGNIKVTFIELGSVKCIPCQKMQVVMKSVEEKYGDQVKVVFYDVWTPEGKPFADTYKINVIPTQVFLDKDGKEYARHEGYFPEEELVKVLNEQGVQ